jgi:chromosome segregation ATPase
MAIEKEKQFDLLDNTRHTLEVKLQEELLENKKEEKKKFQDDRGSVQAQFEAHVELQKCLAESADLRATIENAGIKLDLLQIQVKEYEDVTEYLNNKKDELLEQRKIAEIKNEELRKELVAKEDIAAKRLQAKLNRDKNVEVKELIAQEETAVQHNQELIGKLDEEKKKYEGLLDEKLEIDEHLRVATRDMEETKSKLAEQDAFVADLKAKIEAQTKVTEELNAKTEEERKINRLEEERFRKLGQMNAALRAKLEFIQAKYDFTTNIKVLNTDDFNSLVSTNNIVKSCQA